MREDDLAAGTISSTAAPMTSDDLARVIGKMDSPELVAAIIAQQRVELDRLRGANQLAVRILSRRRGGDSREVHAVLDDVVDILSEALHTEDAQAPKRPPTAKPEENE